jgi:hypothetical protein
MMIYQHSNVLVRYRDSDRFMRARSTSQGLFAVHFCVVSENAWKPNRSFRFDVWSNAMMINRAS